MKKSIYLLECVEYFGFDNNSREDVENRWVIGYFRSEEKLYKAQSLCKKSGITERQLIVKKYDMELNYNQVFVYVLNYEYTKIVNGEYEDYYYSFAPKSSRKKCNLLREKLREEEKYKPTQDKIFEETQDGFWIDRIKLDFVSHIGYFSI